MSDTNFFFFKSTISHSSYVVHNKDSDNFIVNCCNGKRFPNTLCISVNEAVVHGIPGKKPLKNGDIVSVDCGVLKNNYFGDHAYTYEVGEISDEIRQLLSVTKESLYRGINKLKVGNRIGDVSNEIQLHVCIRF